MFIIAISMGPSPALAASWAWISWLFDFLAAS